MCITQNDIPTATHTHLSQQDSYMSCNTHAYNKRLELAYNKRLELAYTKRLEHAYNKRLQLAYSKRLVYTQKEIYMYTTPSTNLNTPIIRDLNSPIIKDLCTHRKRYICMRHHQFAVVTHSCHTPLMSTLRNFACLEYERLQYTCKRLFRCLSLARCTAAAQAHTHTTQHTSADVNDNQTLIEQPAHTLCPKSRVFFFGALFLGFSRQFLELGRQIRSRSLVHRENRFVE